MKKQQPRDQVYRFDQSPAAQAGRLRKLASATPAGVKRDELLRRAVQIEASALVDGWSDTAD